MRGAHSLHSANRSLNLIRSSRLNPREWNRATFPCHVALQLRASVSIIPVIEINLRGPSTPGELDECAIEEIVRANASKIILEYIS
jgi:hypothetical protein